MLGAFFGIVGAVEARFYRAVGGRRRTTVLGTSGAAKECFDGGC